MVLTLRNRLKLLVYFGAVAIFVMSLLDGGPAAGLSFKRLSLLELILFSLITTFDRFLWRWWVVPAIFKTGPIIRGTWKGSIRPTDMPDAPIEAYLSVRQTFSGVALRLLTQESSSESTSAQITQHPEGLAVIEYLFENIPRDSIRNRSPIHFGAAILQVVGTRPERFEGEYFTSRRSTGELEFEDRKSQVAHTYRDAQELFRNAR